ncbi:uncharacterized protein LOC123005411 isoform X2 [Tribolium madens]|uniref:uncharacterized protein LOC123005411 isoform X2 n=1 Tax=Tribolium madens TaxID=41895 RepID=UPI001CF733B7|nr:uncharacterized protein LOC123005411 isoform X2 [Tribolium madens]
MKTGTQFFVLVVIVGTVRASHLGVGLVGPGTHGVVLQGPGSKTTLLGPDGSHISGYAAGGTVVAPAHHGGVVSAAVAPGYVGVAPLLATGSGHEGQYIPDYTEHLYDDGSYKGDLYDEHY